MRQRVAAHLAAAWAIAFAAPHVYWATGRTEGLGTALSNEVVADAGTRMAVSCGVIALFCLCGAATALATTGGRPSRVHRLAPRVLTGLVWLGAVLLVARSVDIFVEFNLVLTGIAHVPAADHANYLHLARWFMFGYLPWFVLGAVAWTRLAWTYTRSVPRGKALAGPVSGTPRPSRRR